MLLAPVAYQRLVHPDGEAATALAAAAQGAGLVLSAQSSVPLERVAGLVRDDAGRGPLWFQLVLPHDRGFLRDLLARVEAAGFEALVLTVDAPVNGVRDRERRARFTLPAGVRAINLDGLAPPPTVGAAASSTQCSAHAATWADVDWLLQQTRLPVLLKGVLHADDARRAVAQGAAGVIVSNHGGRTLDTALATADALPRIVQAVAGQVPVLVDGGIRRGTDVLKRLRAGRRAVLIGRPQVHALAVAGPHGVAHLLRLLRDELEVAMALCGCATLAQAGSNFRSRSPCA
jgi:4-hydroxymandelate oxidase